MSEKFDPLQSATAGEENTSPQEPLVDEEGMANALAVVRKLQTWRDELLKMQQAPSVEVSNPKKLADQ
ncbi:MAG: hypothetical protein JST16_05340 [Bdellovibrionales bacterium]|nr:hypothetical protein [Bdellovibrionales bacterium]